METPDTNSPEYNKGTSADMGINVELVVNDKAEAMVLHDVPFDKTLSWLEFDLNNSQLDFIMNDGDIRNFGIPVDPKLTKYLQNTYQVLMVIMDKETKEPVAGNYFPLIIHKA